ncbi:MAG: gamma-glutamylcyclotransferase [Rhodospirillales bacterium]|nr:gamma-glutamylcyclotransferase [Rhodospirillales bacterium]
MIIKPSGLLGPFTCFFYGTLMDRDVLTAVSGKRVGSLARRSAVLEGYYRPTRAGAVYPILQRCLDEFVYGIVVHGLRAQEVARLNAHEGREYDTAPLSVMLNGRMVTALAYVPRPWVPASPERWCFDTWRRRHKAECLARITIRNKVTLHPLRRPKPGA